jgi:sec-independent protein translocase protein TatC
MAGDNQLTFAEHIRELRSRLVRSLIFVLIGAAIGYALHDVLLVLLQRPLHDTLYYNTPTGAFSFIVKICVTFGIITALPVVIYQTFSFFGPLIKARTRRQFVSYVCMSFLLATAGIVFAYLVSLPAALHFLVNFGEGKGDIQALITADEYFNFVLTYIAGFAVMFQLPLIISFINRMKPMQPQKLIGHTRYVVLFSFIAAAIITPTPDPFNQFIMAAPIVLLYFVSVLVVAMTNAKTRRAARKVHAATPHIASKTIDAILESLPPTPQMPTMSLPDLAQAQSAVRKVMDMPAPVAKRSQHFVSSMDIRPRTRSASTYVERRAVRRAIEPVQQPPQRLMSLPSASRMISDFIPAAK